MEDVSILAWIFDNEIKNEKGEVLDFSDRLFLLDILTDWSQEIVIKKCSQVGGSVVFNLKTFFAVLKLGWNVIYTMPTDGDILGFVKTKTNPILEQNPSVFTDIDHDSIELKKLGDRFLKFKGTISKTAAISDSADALVHDEASRSDQSQMAMYKSRLDASQYKRRWWFSNPTTEKDIIDQKWKESDQKEWVCTCDNGHSEMVKWPNSIDIEKKMFVCPICKVELTREQRRKGHWEAQYPENKVSGYHISHLIAPWKTADEIIKDSEGDQEYFFNFVLGEPYNPGDLSVSRSTILDNWTPKVLETGNWYLGVDVGNIKHYALGSERGVIKVGRFSKWSDLDDMMAMYKPTMVIDANPDNTMARYFVENYLNTCMSVFKDHPDNPKVIVWWGKGSEANDKLGIVYSDRNKIIDQLIDDILNAKILFGVATDREFKEFIKHWETLRRIKVVNTKGIESYEWDSTTGVDHFVFATLYYYLAVLGRGSGQFFSQGSEKAYEFIGRDNVVGDISEMFERMNAVE